jgi:hypothetical protein
MADERGGTKFAQLITEIDLDRSKYDKKLDETVEAANTATIKIEKAFKELGVRTDQSYQDQKTAITKFYRTITEDATVSANERANAEAMLHKKIEALNAKQYSGIRTLTAQKMQVDKNYQDSQEQMWRTLGTRSDQAIESQKQHIMNSYSQLKSQAVGNSTELVRLEAAKNAQLKALSDEMVGKHEMSMASMTRAVLRFYAAYYILSQVLQAVITPIKMAITYLSTIETATLGIAASFMTGGKFIDQTTGKVLEGSAALAKAQIMSKDLIQELQYANLQTIATLDQLIVAYQQTLPVALARGFNVKQVKDFTLAMVQAAGAIGLPMDQMGEETRSLLTGSINPRNSRIATVLGLRNEDIAMYKSNAQGLFDFLMAKLDAYKIAGIEAQNTWAGLTSNMKDIIGQFFGKAFDPLFESLKYQMIEWTKQIVTLDEATKTIIWNPAFLEGIETIKTGITTIIAEMYRLGIALDVAGKGMAGAQMFLAGPGAALGIESSKKKFEAAAESYLDYGKRMLASDKALQDLAMRGQGFKSTDAGTKGAVSVTTEMGQILYYYKAINDEKVKYQTNPTKPDTEKESTIRRNALTEATALNKEYYDDAIAKSDHWLRMQKLSGEGDLEATKEVIDQKKIALNEWYNAQVGSINKYVDGESKRKAELEKLWRDYNKSWIKFQNDDAEVAAQITKKSTTDATSAMEKEIALGMKLTTASVTRIEAKDKAEQHSFEQYQKMMSANEDLALSDHQRAMNRIAAKAKAEKELIDLQVLAGKISPAQAELDKAKIEGITGQQIAEELAKDAARIADFYSQITGYSDTYYKKKLNQIEAERKLNKTLYNEEIANAKAKQQIGALDQKMFTDKSEQVSKALGDMSYAFTAIGSMYDKNSAEYNRMQDAAKAMIVLQQAVAVANAVAAIANQGLGDPYTAFARIAAMVAAMGGLLASTGMSLGGGGSVSAPSAAYGSNTTVLGGANNQGSESITKSWELLQDTYSMENTKLTGIYNQMKDLNANITGLVGGIVRGYGSFSGVGASTDYNQLSPILSSIAAKGSLFADKIFAWIDQKLFGSTTVSSTASGLSITNGGKAVQSYTDIIKETSWSVFGGAGHDEHSTVLGAIDEELTRLFSGPEGIYTNLTKTFGELAKGFGTDTNAALNYIFADAKLNLQGLDAEGIQKAVSEFISKAGDEAVKTLFGTLISQYQQVGEGLLQTAIRLVVDKESVLSALDMTNKAFSGTAMEAVALSESLIEIAGGLDKLTEAASTYYDKFFTDAEKQVKLQGTLTDAMKELGYDALPQTREQFRQIVEALDITTKGGQETYVALMKLSPAMDTFISALEDALNLTISGATDALGAYESAISSAASEARSLANEYKSISASLHDAILSIRGIGTQDAEKTRFNATYAKAMTGDKTALAALPGLAQSYLTESMTTSKSLADFNREKGKILLALTEAEKVSNSMQGYAEYQAHLFEGMLSTLTLIKQELQKGVSANLVLIEGWMGNLANAENALGWQHFLLTDFTPIIDGLGNVTAAANNLYLSFGKDGLKGTADDLYISFGLDGLLGTIDDVIMKFGPDGLMGTADDVAASVAEMGGAADRVVLSFGPDGLQGTADDLYIAFGPDGLLGTADDLIYTFGPDGLMGTLDDVVSSLSLFDWSEQIDPVAWDLFISTVDWSNFVNSLSWDVFVGSMAWDSFVGSLAWNDFVGSFGWNDFVGSLSWSTFINSVSWDSFVGSLAWDKFMTTLAWKDFMTSLSWNDFMESLSWPSFINSVAWTDFVETMGWDAFVPGMDWTTYISGISWDAFVPGVTWGDYIGSINWSPVTAGVGGLIGYLDSLNTPTSALVTLPGAFVTLQSAIGSFISAVNIAMNSIINYVSPIVAIPPIAPILPPPLEPPAIIPPIDDWSGYGKYGPWNDFFGTVGPPNLTAAMGYAFSGGNVIPFSNGGIYNRPTMFPMANGTGLMGEAGPEAVMPLIRIGGKLGVQSTGNNVILIEELRALREEIKAGNVANAKNTLKTAKILDRWDVDGQPAERVLV